MRGPDADLMPGQANVHPETATSIFVDVWDSFIPQHLGHLHVKIGTLRCFLHHARLASVSQRRRQGKVKRSMFITKRELHVVKLS
eukprot:g10216.t1